MLGCSSTVLCVMYLSSEKLALMGKTGRISAPRASGTVGTIEQVEHQWSHHLRRAPESVESNQNKVLSVMETLCGAVFESTKPCQSC